MSERDSEGGWWARLRRRRRPVGEPWTAAEMESVVRATFHRAPMAYEDAQRLYPCWRTPPHYCLGFRDEPSCPSCIVRFLAQDPGDFTAKQLSVIHSLVRANAPERWRDLDRRGRAD